jgi:nicotinic acetylcholine receptor
VDVIHRWQDVAGTTEWEEMEDGIQMNEFYPSTEWDVMGVPAIKSHFFYAGSEDPFTMWTFKIQLRRRFLFYTVNMIIPLMSHVLLTILVFYLPSSSGEKVSLAVNVLLSLTMFFLMLAETIPPTSLVVPLLGKYLLFTLYMVTLSLITTSVTLGVNFRSAAISQMPVWVRKIFLYALPKILRMRRPKIANSQDVQLKHLRLKLCDCFSWPGVKKLSSDNEIRYQFGSRKTRAQIELMATSKALANAMPRSSSPHSTVANDAIEGAIFIANHLREEDFSNRVRNITY